MKLEIRNKGTARNFTCDQPWACISVSTYEGEWPNLSEENLVDVLRLAFADMDFPRPDRVMFDEHMAQSVLDFYEAVEQKGAEVLMVHCEAGLSRSPAIAAGLSKVHTGDDSMYFQRYMPNRFVYRKLLETADFEQ